MRKESAERLLLLLQLTEVDGSPVQRGGVSGLQATPVNPMSFTDPANGSTVILRFDPLE